MVVDPDDLLIFGSAKKQKENKESANNENKAHEEVKTAKVAEVKEELPKEQAPKPPTENIATKTTEEEIYEAVERIKGAANSNIEESKPIPNTEVLEEEYSKTKTETGREGYQAYQSSKGEMTKAENRNAAKSMKCAWHPWRGAYAICKHCGLAFCYDDIIESKSSYFCLQDTDTEPENPAEKIIVKFNNMSMISAALFLAVFVVLVYFTNGVIVYTFQYISKVGILGFIEQISIPYVMVILEILFVFMSCISGILIFVNSRKGFGLGLATAAPSAILFVYQYLNTGKIYYIAIGFMSLAALATLVYSRSVYYEEESIEAYEPSSSATIFPGGGHF